MAVGEKDLVELPEGEVTHVVGHNALGKGRRLSLSNLYTSPKFSTRIDLNTAAYSASFRINGSNDLGWYVGATGAIDSAQHEALSIDKDDGRVKFPLRPTWGNNAVPWDSENFDPTSPVFASEQEAIDGENETRPMNSLRTKQQIDARIADTPTVIAGTDSEKLVASDGVKAAYVQRRKSIDGPNAFDFIPAGWQTAIENGTSTADVTEELQTFFAELGGGALADDAKGRRGTLPAGLYNIEDQISVPQIGWRTEGGGPAGTVLKLRAGLAAGKSVFDFRQSREDYSNVGLALRGLTIDMGGYAGDGITLWKPYDCVSVEDVFIKEVADGNRGVMIRPDPDINPGDPWSQGVYMRNVIAAHKAATHTAAAPLFYIQNLNEAVFVLCKAFAAYSLSGGLSPCNGFELVDCNGVNFINPSVAFGSNHAFLVRSTGTSVCRANIIDTPTIEGGSGVIKTAGVAGIDEVNMVLDLEVRSPRIVYPYAHHPDGDFSLARSRRGVFDTKVFTVNGQSDSAGNRYRSDAPFSSFTGGSKMDVIERPPILLPTTTVEASRSADQVIPSGAFTYVVFNSETTDAASEFDATAGAFTAAKTGTYRVDLSLFIAPTASTLGQRSARAVKNGLEGKTFFMDATSTTLGYVRFGQIEVDLAAGDTFRVELYADMGATIIASAERTYLKITPVFRPLVF